MPDLPFGLSVTPSSSSGTAAAVSVVASGAVLSIGRGIVSPLRRSSNDVVTATDIDLLKNNMRQILGTRAGSEYSTGELPWRTEFGSLLHILRHRPNDIVTQELARIYVVEALGRWEPRIRITSVKITKEAGPTGNAAERPVLLVRIGFDIRAVRGDSLIASGQSLAIAA